jgi:hypothetical protein
MALWSHPSKHKTSRPASWDAACDHNHSLQQFDMVKAPNNYHVLFVHTPGDVESALVGKGCTLIPVSIYTLDKMLTEFAQTSTSRADIPARSLIE